MPPPSALRRADCQGTLQVLRALGLLALLVLSGAARADALDDTLARFLDDKFPQTETAIGELAAEGPPQGAAILEALGDNRLLINPAGHAVAYKTAAGSILNAKTGETIPAANAAAFKKVRVNNALRRAIQGAVGSLTAGEAARHRSHRRRA
jgi:urea transport system permease protein